MEDKKVFRVNGLLENHDKYMIGSCQRNDENGYVQNVFILEKGENNKNGFKICNHEIPKPAMEHWIKHTILNPIKCPLCIKENTIHSISGRKIYNQNINLINNSMEIAETYAKQNNLKLIEPKKPETKKMKIEKTPLEEAKDSLIDTLVKEYGLTKKNEPKIRKATEKIISESKKETKEEIEEKTEITTEKKPCEPPKKKSAVKFTDIAGQEEAKLALKSGYVMTFDLPLLFPIFNRAILLYGPPGTGKTLLAKAASAELENIAFYYYSLGQILSKYIGETEQRIERFFECAYESIEKKESRAAVIFLDEFDAIGGKKQMGEAMVGSVNTLLSVIDGFETKEGVSIMAATNYPWKLEESILSRFSARIFVDLPDTKARDFIIHSELISIYKDLSNITKYGSPKNSILTKGYIDDIVKHFGPTKEFEEIKDYILNTTEQVTLQKIEKKILEISEVKKISAGYSARDIVKVIQLASINASNRALKNDRFAKKDQLYYAIPEDVKIKKIFKIDEIKEKDKITTFDIQIDDVDRAIKSYPSTIEIMSYIQVFAYAHNKTIGEFK